MSTCTAADAGDAAQGADELADTLLEQPAVAAGRKARAQIDGDDAMRDGDRAQRGRARNGRADATAALGRRRPGEQLLRPPSASVVPPRGTETGFPSATNQTSTPAPAEPAERERGDAQAREKRCISWQSDSPPAAPHFLPIGRRQREPQATRPPRR